MDTTAAESADKVAGVARAATRPAVVPMTSVPRAAWHRLGDAAVQANGFYAADYALAAATLSHRPGLLLAHADNADRDLIGLLPVVSAWHALHLPVPALIARQAYSPLSVPLLHRDAAVTAAGALIDAAAAAGARVLSLPAMTLDGPAFAALQAAMSRRGLRTVIHNRHERAAFDATQESEPYLRAGLGGKRLKELRRLRNRLADDGAVAFAIASTPADVAAALERFLALEAMGWKGAGGTGLGQNANDAAFIRAAAAGLSVDGRIQIAELTLDAAVIASGLVIRQGPQALFFKIAYDETQARYSPGVQLTLELTHHFAADPAIALVDSTADAGHPMIDHVWRERLPIGDLLIPTMPNDPIAGAIIALMAARRTARSLAKRLLHALANPKEKRP
ncbi:GNAT family N-acetyltransferase [Devosia beringensis]|uniref:GNAT family N-acetyltransferase n=1 Tax=Devosia beringensis TaxID=2657486 RepID=UPI00186B9D2E|nr:GNAT family N-acetyltransferase [Devosia beringensis]